MTQGIAHLLFILCLLFPATLQAMVSLWQLHPSPESISTTRVVWQEYQRPDRVRFIRLWNQGDYTVECIVYFSATNQQYAILLYPNHYSQWYFAGPAMMQWNYVCR